MRAIKGNGSRESSVCNNTIKGNREQQNNEECNMLQDFYFLQCMQVFDS